MSQTLTQYLKNSNKVWQYVGSVFGDVPYTTTGKRMAEDVAAMGYDGPMVEHPANGGDCGYYLQSGNVHYKNGTTDEVVLEVVGYLEPGVSPATANPPLTPAGFLFASIDTPRRLCYTNREAHGAQKIGCIIGGEYSKRVFAAFCFWR